jgi:hypothetical protein
MVMRVEDPLYSRDGDVIEVLKDGARSGID